MDCLLDEIYKVKKFRRKHPSNHEFDDAPKKKRKKESTTSENMKEKMARLRAMRRK